MSWKLPQQPVYSIYRSIANQYNLSYVDQNLYIHTFYALYFPEITCGDVPDVSNAHIKTYLTGNLAIEAKVFYQCNEGFIKISGDPISRCGTDGNWIIPDLYCQSKQLQLQSIDFEHYLKLLLSGLRW